MTEKTQDVAAETTVDKAPSKSSQIRDLYLKGYTYYKIGQELGIRPQFARNVIQQALESKHALFVKENERRLAAKK